MGLFGIHFYIIIYHWGKTEQALKQEPEVKSLGGIGLLTVSL